MKLITYCVSCLELYVLQCFTWPDNTYPLLLLFFLTSDMLTSLFLWCKASAADVTGGDLWLLEHRGMLRFELVCK